MMFMINSIILQLLNKFTTWGNSIDKIVFSSHRIDKDFIKLFISRTWAITLFATIKEIFFFFNKILARLGSKNLLTVLILFFLAIFAANLDGSIPIQLNFFFKKNLSSVPSFDAISTIESFSKLNLNFLTTLE